MGAGEPEQPVRAAAVEVRRLAGGEIHLGAVAGGENDSLAPVRERAGERGGMLEVDGDAFAHLHGRAMVRDADESEPHAGPAVTTRSGSGAGRYRRARSRRAPTTRRAGRADQLRAGARAR